MNFLFFHVRNIPYIRIFLYQHESMEKANSFKRDYLYIRLLKILIICNYFFFQLRIKIDYHCYINIENLKF